MNTIRNIILFGALLAVTSQAAAQNQRIGFIDSDLIMDQMPEYSGIEQRLNLLAENWENEIDRMELELADLRDEFEAREVLYTEEIRQERMNEIRQLEQQIDNYIEDKFGPDGEYFQRQKELLEPIQRLIFDALNRVASRDDFDFVFDRAADTRFLYVNEEWNLTDDVMVELGIDQTGN